MIYTLSIEYVMSYSIISEENHEPLLCTLVVVDPYGRDYVLELSLIPMVVFILRGGSTAL